MIDFINHFHICKGHKIVIYVINNLAIRGWHFLYIFTQNCDKIDRMLDSTQFLCFGLCLFCCWLGQKFIVIVNGIYVIME